MKIGVVHYRLSFTVALLILKVFLYKNIITVRDCYRIKLEVTEQIIKTKVNRRCRSVQYKGFSKVFIALCIQLFFHSFIPSHSIKPTHAVTILDIYKPINVD